jgi:flagellar biosynthesis protein FlhG
MPADKKRARRYAVISGKGGVGNTVITANVAAALAAAGKRTLVIDADLGLANLDVILGLSVSRSLHDVFQGIHGIDEVLVRAPGGFDLLPASSGLPEDAALTPLMAENLEHVVETLDTRYDMVMFDAGAGIGDLVRFFARLAHDILLVVTPEHTSLMDGYATMKILTKTHGRTEFYIVVNQVNPLQPEHAGAMVAEHLQKVASRFLAAEDGSPVRSHLIGSIPSDPAVPSAVSRQKLLKEIEPFAPSTRYIDRLAESLLAQS